MWHLGQVRGCGEGAGGCERDEAAGGRGGAGWRRPSGAGAAAPMAPTLGAGTACVWLAPRGWHDYCQEGRRCPPFASPTTDAPTPPLRSRIRLSLDRRCLPPCLSMGRIIDRRRGPSGAFLPGRPWLGVSRSGWHPHAGCVDSHLPAADLGAGARALLTRGRASGAGGVGCAAGVEGVERRCALARNILDVTGPQM